METPGKESGFCCKSIRQCLDNQCFPSLRKGRTLGTQGLTYDFELGQEGSHRLGRAQHEEKAKQEPQQEPRCGTVKRRPISGPCDR